jgi:hypothetical protein
MTMPLRRSIDPILLDLKEGEAKMTGWVLYKVKVGIHEY